MKKTNRTFKRFAAITSASLLAACMVAPMAGGFTSSAADTGSITINNVIEGHEYYAYQIFEGDLNGTTLSNIVWGDGVDQTNIKSLLNDLALLNSNFADVITYSIPETDTELTAAYNTWKASNAEGTIKDFYNDNEVVSDKTGVVISSTASKIAEALQLFNDADAFARVIDSYLSNTYTSGSFDNGTYTIGKNNGTGTLEDGYYLVTDENQSSTLIGDAYSAYIVEVAGTATVVNPKASAPTAVKKVEENSTITGYSYTDVNGSTVTDANYNDVADYNIGDAVSFKLYGTLPSTYEDYNAYYYCFTDTLGKEFDAPNESNIKVYVDGTEVTNATGNLRVSVTNGNGTADSTITISFEDIKKVAPDKKSVITVMYDAVLNENAVIGLNGQTNAVKLEYSNNPNVDYDYDITDETVDKDNNTGETTEDKVIVFTYALDVDKTFETINGDTLTAEQLGTLRESVKFELRKNNEDGEAMKFSKHTDGYYYVDGSNNTENATKLSLNELSEIAIHGLDKGTYYLVEVAHPADYNQASPQKIVISATTVNGQGWNDFDATKALTGFNYTVGDVTYYQGLDADGNKINENSTDGKKLKDIDAIAKTEVINRQGSSLPGTGGIGTTIFYLGGGAMAAIGGIYLISKRRMKKSEE